LIPFSDTQKAIRRSIHGPFRRVFRQLCFAHDPNEVRGPGLRPRNAQVDGVLVAKLQIVLLHEAIHILQGGREEGEKTQKTHQKTITRSFPNSYFTKKLGYSSGQHHDSHPSKNWPELLLLHSWPTIVISKENTSRLQQVEVQREFLGTESNMAALVTPLDPRAKSTGPVPWINTV